MPDTGASRKRQIARRDIPGDLAIKDHRTSGDPGYRESDSQRNPEVVVMAVPLVD